MESPLLIRGRLYPAGDPAEVVAASGAIREIRAVRPVSGGAALGDDACVVCPGFFDLQVNGFAGVDFNRPEIAAEELRRAMHAMWRHGVTRFLPTVITAALPAMLDTLRALARAREQDPVLAYAMPGIHLEGPFLAPEDGPRGAHPAAHVRDPDRDVFWRLQDAAGGRIRLVTLAPERPGALALIAELSRAGIVVGIGHTAADEATIDEAVRAGARLSTHLGNGAHAVLPRHRNYIQKQLATDALLASLIADGHHLPDFVVKNMIRGKGPERVLLVTDAMAAAAAPPGTYRLGEVVAEAGADGCVRLAGTPYLAGSSLTLDRGVENAARFAGVPLLQALRWVSQGPGSLWPDEAGGIAPGAPADLVLLREGPPLGVEATIVRGEVVFRADAG
jgi:N-acetylglucosamine-6-phosphate deacetylase